MEVYAKAGKIVPRHDEKMILEGVADKSKFGILKHRIKFNYEDNSN
jgi:hypothetical protein